MDYKVYSLLSCCHDYILTPFQTLLETSEPDYTTNTYYGPPIGYCTLVVVHTAPDGSTKTTTYGRFSGPRKDVNMKCEAPVCSVTSASATR